MNLDNLKTVVQDTIATKEGKCLIIAVDMDNTLVDGVMWNLEDVLEPHHEMVAYINKLSERHFIIIHTARRRELAEVTLKWLETNGVRYHAIRFEKLPADLYIDDKAVRP